MIWSDLTSNSGATYGVRNFVTLTPTFHRVDGWRLEMSGRRCLGPGYRAAEVDEFIARIQATLSGNARPGQAVTAADVQAVTFTVTRHGGYDERTMDEVLDHYADELDKTTPFPSATAPGN